MEFLWSSEPWISQETRRNFNASTEDFINLPKPVDLWIYPIFVATFLLVTKYLFLIPYIYTPIAKRCGIKCRNHEPPPFNKTLEIVYNKYGSMPKISLSDYVESVGMTQREILRWLRLRYMSETTTKMSKFLDCSWQLTYYVTSCSIGIYTLYDKPWLFDFSKCWTNFPYQDVPNSVWLYYMTALGFYFEETFIHSLRPKQKDSLQTYVHHICAILLLVGTWLTNILRIGPINVLIFECNDIPLLIAKLLNYSNKKTYTDGFFVMFILTWIVTRLIIYPFGIMKHTFRESVSRADSLFHIYNILNVLMVICMIMNLMWSYSIARVIFKKFTSGEISDVRSSGDESEEDEGEEEVKKKK